MTGLLRGGRWLPMTVGSNNFVDIAGQGAGIPRGY